MPKYSAGEYYTPGGLFSGACDVGWKWLCAYNVTTTSLFYQVPGQTWVRGDALPKFQTGLMYYTNETPSIVSLVRTVSSPFLNTSIGIY